MWAWSSVYLYAGMQRGDPAFFYLPSSCHLYGNTKAPVEAPADAAGETVVEPEHAPAPPAEDQSAAPAHDAPPAEGE